MKGQHGDWHARSYDTQRTRERNGKVKSEEYAGSVEATERSEPIGFEGLRRCGCPHDGRVDTAATGSKPKGSLPLYCRGSRAAGYLYTTTTSSGQPPSPPYNPNWSDGAPSLHLATCYRGDRWPTGCKPGPGDSTARLRVRLRWPRG